MRIEWRTICGVDHDRFEKMLADVGADGLTDLAQRYSYVFPDDRSLAALAGLGPRDEVGAGTGYWASRLRARGVERLEVTANPDALGFYRAAGFTACGLAETQFGTAPRMVLSISRLH